MLTATLRTLYEYNRWATGRLLETAAQLRDEQLRTPGNAGHGSIRDTLIHLVEVQQSWLSWWDGSLPLAQAYGFSLQLPDSTGLEAVRQAWEAAEVQTSAFLERLTDAEAERVFTNELPDGTVFRMQLWQMMLHVANHGTQHRSEVAAMLTAAGHSPGNLDLIFFLWPDGTRSSGS